MGKSLIFVVLGIVFLFCSVGIVYSNPLSDFDDNYVSVIKINNAEHLDFQRYFISLIYDSVREKDNKWFSVPREDYIRVRFEENLNSKNDITLYARGSGIVEVYEKDSDKLLLKFEISGEGTYKQFLGKLDGQQDTFDLRFIGNIDVDYIVDPVTNEILNYNGVLYHRNYWDSVPNSYGVCISSPATVLGSPTWGCDPGYSCFVTGSYPNAFGHCGKQAPADYPYNIVGWADEDVFMCIGNSRYRRGYHYVGGSWGRYYRWALHGTCLGTDDNYCVNGRSACGCKPGATKVVACGSGTCAGTRTDTCNSAGNWVVGDCTYPHTGTVCRASAGTCDQPEYCTSSSSSCPVDSFKSSLTICSGEYAIWNCDGNCKRTKSYSNCTGSSSSCPSSTIYVEYAPAGTLCNQLKGGTSWITFGYCGYSPYNQCSGPIKGRDAYRCNGGNSCSYKVDVVWDGGTCSGLTPYCFEGGCVECIQNSDCPSGKVCQNKQCIISTEPYWATLSGDKINLSNRGDTVLMVAGDLESGESVEYFVEREGSILFGLIKNWEDLTKLGGKGVQQYTFDQEGKYRFKVKIKEGNETFESSYQNISVSSVPSNSRPVADISAPIDFYGGSVNSPILFSQISFDDDDLLKITWNFGDNNNTIFQNYSKSLNANSADVSHFYSKEGNYVVTLIAEEMTRDQSDEDSIQVQIFKQGINIIPIISSPAMDSIQGYVVWYNASQSYVVNCSVWMVSPDFSVGSLGCKYLLKPGEKSPSKGIVRIRWKEIDSEGNVLNWIVGSEQQGVVWDSTNYTDAVVFPKIYKKPEFRRIRLELTYN